METVLGKTLKTTGQIPVFFHHSKPICLANDQTYHIDVRNKSVQVVGVSGKAWITMQGDLKDYLLGPGEKLTISCRGRMVIQGVPEVSLVLYL